MADPEKERKRLARMRQAVDKLEQKRKDKAKRQSKGDS